MGVYGSLNNAQQVAGRQQNSFGNMAQGLIGQANQQGLFNPMGSPAINQAVRSHALRNADNARRRSALLSRLMGLDPNQARVAAVNADAQGSANTSDALNNARYGQLMGGQQFARSLFTGQLSNEQNLQNQLRMIKAQRDATNPGIGGFVGGLAGQAIGGLTGGLFRPRAPQAGAGAGGGGAAPLTYGGTFDPYQLYPQPYGAGMDY